VPCWPSACSSICIELAKRLRGVTHRHILREVWGPGAGHQTHTVRVHMAALRRKLEPDPARPRLLVTELAVGYRLRDE
jgi:two-component system KDP operon response regulator KdpE